MTATNINELLLNKIKQASNPNQPVTPAHPRYRIEIHSPRTEPNLSGATEPVFSPEETALLVVTAAMIDVLDGVLPGDLLNLGSTPCRRFLEKTGCSILMWHFTNNQAHPIK